MRYILIFSIILHDYRCKVRVIDSFGTEAEYNFRKFSETDKRYESLWGNLDLNLRQFMTMFRTLLLSFFITYLYFYQLMFDCHASICFQLPSAETFLKSRKQPFSLALENIDASPNLFSIE